jgi:hypothetical protein
VRCAYLTLLGREVDASGLENYLTQVRDGVDKSQIVVQLALSDEGRQRPRILPGLDTFLGAHAPRSLRWHRRLVRRALRPWLDTTAEPLARTLRILDNRLSRIEAALHVQTVDLTAVRSELAQLGISVDSGRGGGTAQVPSAGSGLPRLPLPRQAPAHVERIYRGLQRMWARRVGLPH